MIRILIVDDHMLVREGLKGVLSGQPDFEVVGEAADGVTAVQQAELLQPDVVLIDLRMPEGDGVTAVATMREKQLPVHILILTTWETDEHIARALDAGADGYLLKDTKRETLFAGVRSVINGVPAFAPAVAERLKQAAQEPTQKRLSDRELQVLLLLAAGGSNKAIGRDLHISEATVKTHLVNIYHKLDVKDRAAAVSLGYQRGLLPLD